MNKEIKNILIGIGIISIVYTLIVFPFLFSSKITCEVTETRIEDSSHTGELYDLLKSEIIDIPEGNCVNYSTYYAKMLSSEKYEGYNLDLKWINGFDICNNRALCNSTHTFLVVGGFGQECILDQKKLNCLNVLK